jgi:adenine phosphoribosyltransferase
MDLASTIRTIPDFPKPGIMFRDITTLMANAAALKAAIDQLAAPYEGADPSLVAGIEARGFILGAAVAIELGVGFVPMRKSGKLPHEVVTETYDLEYGTDTLEMHKDAVPPGARVVLIDDLIATGGTAVAAVSLLRRSGASIVGAGFVIDLPDLGGAARLRALGVPVTTLVGFEGH